MKAEHNASKNATQTRWLPTIATIQDFLINC